MATVWMISDGLPVEGYGQPACAFTTEAAAVAFLASIGNNGEVHAIELYDQPDDVPTQKWRDQRGAEYTAHPWSWSWSDVPVTRFVQEA